MGNVSRMPIRIVHAETGGNMPAVRSVSAQQFMLELRREVNTHSNPRALAIRNEDVPPVANMPHANVYFSYFDGGRKTTYWLVQENGTPLDRTQIAELIIAAFGEWFTDGNKAANFLAFIARRSNDHWKMMNFIGGQPLLGSYA